MSELTTNDNGFTVTTEFAATPRDLYDAWTVPDILTHWLVTECEVDVRIGGRYIYEWPEGLSARGEYLELVPGERLVQTWESWGPEGRYEGADATITVEFRDLGNGRASMAQTEASDVYVSNPDMAEASAGGAIEAHKTLAAYFAERA